MFLAFCNQTPKIVAIKVPLSVCVLHTVVVLSCDKADQIQFNGSPCPAGENGMKGDASANIRGAILWPTSRLRRHFANSRMHGATLCKFRYRLPVRENVNANKRDFQPLVNDDDVRGSREWGGPSCAEVFVKWRLTKISRHACFRV